MFQFPAKPIDFNFAEIVIGVEKKTLKSEAEQHVCETWLGCNKTWIPMQEACSCISTKIDVIIFLEQTQGSKYEGSLANFDIKCSFLDVQFQVVF